MLVWESINKHLCTDEELDLFDEDETQSGHDDIGSVKAIEAIKPWNSE